LLKRNSSVGLIIVSVILFSLTGCGEGSKVNRVIGKVVGFFSPRIKTSEVNNNVSISSTLPSASEGNNSNTMDTTKIDTAKEVIQALNWEKFYYDDLGKPDPFEPLITKKTISKGLHVEQAELVGIISGAGGYLALVKEKGGAGYVLREGDGIVGGKVSHIDKNSITFSMFQFGVHSTVVLHLKEREGEK